ncbi:signal recognition particle-docking protein FtsY [Vitreoscilla massiliensis]
MPTAMPTPAPTAAPVLEDMQPVNAAAAEKPTAELAIEAADEIATETDTAAKTTEPQGWARGIAPNKALSGHLDEAETSNTTEAATEETSFFTQNWTRNIVAEDKEIVVKPTAAPVATAAPVVQQDPNQNFEPGQASGWTARLKQGLSKSRDKLGKSLAGVFGGADIDDDLYEELETVLLTSDMGVEATEHLLEDVRQRVSLKGLKNPQELREALKDALVDLIAPLQQPLEIPADAKPFVIMMAGVNGAGKTTSIGKLATHYQRQGKSVLLAAGDTFRAAAREQLIEWGARNNVTVISQATGDSAAVCFDAMHAAQARGTDIVLADTAGRLPTQLHLMEEIKKVKRVMQKSMDTAPHEVILVLDANIGQNAVNQVIAFDDALGLTGLILTKLDGTAKGGVIAALAKTRPIPIRFIGVGEGIEDLRPFNARDYAEALLGD